MGLSENIIHELKRRRDRGIAQNEIESLFGFSRSHVSETISKLEKEGKILRRNDENGMNRIWLDNFFPYYRENIIRIGFLKSSEYIPFLSVASNISESVNIKLLLIDYNDSIKMMDDLNRGIIEIALAPLFTQIVYAVSNNDIKIIGAVASGGSCILENEKADADICASTESSSMMLIMREFLKKNGEHRVKNFRYPKKALDMLKESRIKYLAIWEPYMSAAGETVAMKYDEAMNGFPCCAVSAKKQNSERSIVKMIMKGYMKYNARDTDTHIELYFSKITGIRIEIVRKSLESYNFRPIFNSEIVKKYLAFTGFILSDDKIHDIFDFRYSTG